MHLVEEYSEYLRRVWEIHGTMFLRYWQRLKANQRSRQRLKDLLHYVGKKKSRSTCKDPMLCTLARWEIGYNKEKIILWDCLIRYLTVCVGLTCCERDVSRNTFSKQRGEWGVAAAGYKECTLIQTRSQEAFSTMWCPTNALNCAPLLGRERRGRMLWNL